jgi:hypothetical protein
MARVHSNDNAAVTQAAVGGPIVVWPTGAASGRYVIVIASCSPSAHLPTGGERGRTIVKRKVIALAGAAAAMVVGGIIIASAAEPSSETCVDACYDVRGNVHRPPRRVAR